MRAGPLHGQIALPLRQTDAWQRRRLCRFRMRNNNTYQNCEATTVAAPLLPPITSTLNTASKFCFSEP